MNIPPKKLLRIGDVIEWTGVSRSTVDAWADAGLVRPVRYKRKCRHAIFYRRDEIIRNVFDETPPTTR